MSELTEWLEHGDFRGSLQHEADTLFQPLDNTLEPQALLVCIPISPLSSSTEIHLQCGDALALSKAPFRALGSLAANHLESYPEFAMAGTSPEARELGLDRRSMRDAIKEVLASHPDALSTRCYVSFPETVGDHWVFMVVALQSNAVETYRELSRSTVPIHDFRAFPIPVSLLEAASEELFQYASGRLWDPVPFLEKAVHRQELLRMSGVAMARGLAARLFEKFSGQGGNLFRNLVSISYLGYERREGSGRVVLAAEGHPSLKNIITFEDPISLGDHPRVRKMLEVTSDSLFLHSDGTAVFGVVESEAYDHKPEDRFDIVIHGRGSWEARHGEDILWTVRDGVPGLPKTGRLEDDFRARLRNIFGAMEEDHVQHLLSLVAAAEQARHGTILVVSGAADEEAKRLASEGTTVAPFLLTPAVVRQVSSIDGAILIDTVGGCHAIGTILDGEATQQGNPARGARFNSAVRYMANSSKASPCIAVVVSEDGNVEVLSS